MGNRHVFTIAALFCFAVLCLLHICTQPASAAEPRTVRVGLPPIGQFSRLENGKPVGYITDQLEQLTRYTGWNVSCVILDDWDACLHALETGKIDLATPARYSAERARKYLYCAQPIGTSYTAIIAPSDSPVIYDDIESISRMRVGMIPNSIWLNDFAAFMQQRGATMPTIIEYSDQEELRAATHSGQVDAILESVLLLEGNEKNLGQMQAFAILLSCFTKEHPTYART